ncbi:hypothetical protein [Picrophilus oshimae]|uniref:Hypothetical membrane spanning protein n=1 Tax=Picrophilus torridus (strain ATCC 700027 / DSM 9790 / JCM 10055 / NBRC 100828 / KAW 2/3) TaxID=1122961 RepID=Q6L2M1_PICTO|nr:hypothetical protein [Picrophilus oshimae]AAT42781.1 hypothetical membrane spanning protein [Picrophilus oshimae DSM 9789]
MNGELKKNGGSRLLNGLKAGIISGFIFFLIASIVEGILYTVFIDGIVDYFNVPVKDYSIFYTLLIDHEIESNFIIGIVMGPVFAILMIYLYNGIKNLLKTNARNRALAFGILLWIIFYIILQYQDILINIVFAVAYIVVTFILGYIFGILLYRYISRYPPYVNEVKNLNN